MREFLEDALCYDTDVLESALKDLDRRIERDKYLISSAEAKIQRVEPNSQEFREAVELIEEVKESMRNKQRDRLIMDLELKRRKYIE